MMLLGVKILATVTTDGMVLRMHLLLTRQNALNRIMNKMNSIDFRIISKSIITMADINSAS